jgi:hypothetical protein
MAATIPAADRLLTVRLCSVDNRGAIAPAGNPADGHPET